MSWQLLCMSGVAMCALVQKGFRSPGYLSCPEGRSRTLAKNRALARRILRSPSTRSNRSVRRRALLLLRLSRKYKGGRT